MDEISAMAQLHRHAVYLHGADTYFVNELDFAVVDARNLERDALFLHDRYPGGMGYARRCLDRFDAIMQTIAEVVRNCGCEDGCPSCVGSAVPAFATTDLDSPVRGRIASKKAARYLLDETLG